MQILWISQIANQKSDKRMKKVLSKLAEVACGKESCGISLLKK